jgi:hypothetical protein
MRKPLNLEQTTFDLQDWVKACRDEIETIRHWIPAKRTPKALTIPARKLLTALPKEMLVDVPNFTIRQEDEVTPGHFVMLPFFGTVFCGLELVTDERWRDNMLSDFADHKAPILACPAHWTLAKLLGSLKVFSSVGDAKRNGWDKKSDQGWEWHLVRIAKLKGILCVVTPTDAILRPGSWEACSDEANPG